MYSTANDPAMPVAPTLTRPNSKFGVASTPPALPDTDTLVVDLADDTSVLLHEDDFDVVVSPGEFDHQALWLKMVQVRVPAALGLAHRLLGVLQHGGINVIRITEPVRQALLTEPRNEEVQLAALVRSKLVAIHVRHLIPSELLLVLSEGPGDGDDGSPS